MTWPPHTGWEVGYTDRHGRRWLHKPHQGWTASQHRPYLFAPPEKWWTRWPRRRRPR